MSFRIYFVQPEGQGSPGTTGVSQAEFGKKIGYSWLRFRAAIKAFEQIEN
jgi:hypothetical protein